MTDKVLDSGSGAAIYSPLALKLYDLVVLCLSNSFAWTCPTRSVLLPFFKAHLSDNHLDVGVGTGFYLAEAEVGREAKISLLDLNPNSLKAAMDRFGRPCDTYVGDVMKPDPLPDGCRFSSISLFYLYHCLPGSMTEKSAAVAHLAPYLEPGGVVYGATILGDSAGHNAFGRRLMKIYNTKGVFGNRDDSQEGLARTLGAHFRDVEIRREGRVALFTLRAPISES
ncbi:class I SAM-dependent methyltransferase [Allorhizobium taibaishanense]|uniref:SAM-dependent methyltransferase n=1 Tax=Allorhizobium taibaishanense TaxID=887144 RepID=A0A1Q8ZZ18_9HYPH|nr:class I SAM-dependent methyltransferase [Allorhizobium taibaishanense]MBB4007466.1 SAM-dependent methyltransferase [Allorhizobium taibaishanense]OLP47582.1 SAM-dependent methyltransferase [Allorhizobium taibaishanense]